jgi:DNA-binding NarL/FixJ family response regulator
VQIAGPASFLLFQRFAGEPDGAQDFMDKISVIIVEDHPLFRQGIIDALSFELDISVVGDAGTGEDGLRIIREMQPHVAILDVNLPGINGQQITRQLVNDQVPTRIILLTGYDDTEQKIHAMRSGAAAFCTKNIQPKDLIEVVRQVYSGHFVIDHRVFDQDGLKNYLGGDTDDPKKSSVIPSEPVLPLSVREMEVLSCVTQGMSNKEIARYLNISQQTVKNHITSILRKLGLEDRTQAAIFAVREGWVRLQKPLENPQE